MKLQDNIVALIGLHPKCVSGVISDCIGRHGVQIHYLALNRAASRVGAEAVYPYGNSMRLALKYALVRLIHLNHYPIDRTHHTEWHCGYVPTWVSKNQKKHDEKDNRTALKDNAEISKRKPTQNDRDEQKRNALVGNERVSSTLQRSSIPATKRQATIPCFAL